jgi:small GTP-binding protein
LAKFICEKCSIRPIILEWKKMSKKTQEFRFKICVIGAETSGKTSILNRYIFNEFSHPHSMNIGVEFFTKDFILDDFNVHLVFFDPGKQLFDSLRANYFKGTSGVLIVIDLTDKDSFETIKPWLDPLRNKLVGNVPIIIMGNKFDIANERKVSFDEAWKFAIDHKLIYFETSAKSGYGIEESITYLTRLMIGRVSIIPERAIYIDFKGVKSTLSILKQTKKLAEIRLDTPHGISSLSASQELDMSSIRQINEEITEFTAAVNEIRRIRSTDVKNKEIKTKGSTAIEQLKSLGEELYNITIPQDIQEIIEQLNMPIQLVIDEKLLGFVWELMYDGDDFLCLKSIGRKIESEYFFVPDINTETRENINFLLIVDPKEKDATYRLPNAQIEGRKIIKMLKGFKNVNSKLLSGNDASVDAVKKELEKGIYDFIHFAGHASFNIEHPEQSGLLLADDYLYAADILEAIKPRPPILAFINACESSKTSIPEGEVSFESDIYGLASAFLQGGVFYIGALWPVHDDVAIQTAVSFYKRLLSEQTIGTALMNAKKEIRNEYGNIEIGWLTYILYGDPTLYLKIS